jgi:hypothetical protein
MDKAEIGHKILEYFASTNSVEEQAFDLGYLSINLFSKLSSKESDLLEPAINDLIDQGLVKLVKKGSNQFIILTKIGFNKIFPIDNDQVIAKIKSRIMQRFEEQNVTDRHIIPDLWISKNLFQELNPREQLLVNEAIRQLAREKFVAFGEGGIKNCLVLIKGFGVYAKY